MQKLLINDFKSNNSEVKSNNAVEKMAKEIHSLKNYDTYWADECRELASDLYARGWRKQSEGEWRFSGYSLMGDRAYECSECGFAVANIDDVYMKFCPNCAAQMKGGTE